MVGQGKRFRERLRVARVRPVLALQHQAEVHTKPPIASGQARGRDYTNGARYELSLKA